MSDIQFNETLVLTEIEGADQTAVLEFMAGHLCKLGLVKDSYAAAVINREKTFATGLPTQGCGVAIPHTDIEHVNQAAICVGVLKNEVDFGIMGEETETVPVKLIFMLAMNAAHAQLALLQKLMQVFQDKETLSCLAVETSKAKIKQVVCNKLALEGGE